MKLIVSLADLSKLHSYIGLTDLIPTLLSLSTTHLPYHILDVSLRQVCAYLSKFRMRLSARNLVHLKRLVVFLDALKKTLIQWKEKQCNDLSSTSRSAERLEVLTLAELLDQMGRKAAGINLLEIGQYLKESKVRTQRPFVIISVSHLF